IESSACALRQARRSNAALPRSRALPPGIAGLYHSTGRVLRKRPRAPARMSRQLDSRRPRMVTTGGVPSEPQWGYALGMERWHPLRVAACMAVCVAFGVRTAVAEPGSDDAPSHRENDAPPVDDGPTVDPAYDQDRLQSGRLLFWKGYEQFKSGNFAEAVKTF